MIVSDIIAALDLPSGARVVRRVPKMLLAEHGAPTAAEKLLQQSYHLAPCPTTRDHLYRPGARRSIDSRLSSNHPNNATPA